ncbi:hypothetical protein Ancab_010972 [Ancistrocladus abbreviatus]
METNLASRLVPLYLYATVGTNCNMCYRSIKCHSSVAEQFGNLVHGFTLMLLMQAVLASVRNTGTIWMSPEILIVLINQISNLEKQRKLSTGSWGLQGLADGVESFKALGGDP